MKKKTNLLTKIKVCLSFLFKKGKPMTHVVCHHCDSPFVKFENGQKNANCYTSNYFCIKCGATCINVETWEPRKE